MKNNALYNLSSKVLINIKGKNIDKFIKRINSKKIEILELKYISSEDINILIKKEDLKKLEKIKTVYEIKIIDFKGLEKAKNIVLNSKYIIIFVLFFLIILYILSNIIFDINIITTDSKMKEILLEDLNNEGIKKYKFKKNYIEIEKIKKKILSNHKSDIEWIEIECIGTKYIIKYEPRIKNKKSKEIKKQNIISKYDALIKNMNITKGEIIKDVGTYVKKGDIIVSGEVKLNEELKEIIGARGNVYGEVWYNVKVKYPYKYYEERETGRKSKVLVIKFLNKKIELFNVKKYNKKIIEEKIILNNYLLPINISFENQKEIKVINKKYNENELIDESLKYSIKKIEKILKKDEYIYKYKVLNKSKNKNSLTLNIFFSVIKNITLYKNIEYN